MLAEQRGPAHSFVRAASFRFSPTFEPVCRNGVTQLCEQVDGLHADPTCYGLFLSEMSGQPRRPPTPVSSLLCHITFRQVCISVVLLFIRNSYTRQFRSNKTFCLGWKQYMLKDRFLNLNTILTSGPID